MNDFQLAVDDFDLFNEARGLTSITRSWYGYQLRLFAAFLDAKSIAPAAIAGRDILAFLAEERRKGLADRSVCARFVCLRTFFRWVERNGYLDGLRNPVRAEYKPKADTTEPKRVELAAYQQLLASIAGIRWIDARDRALLAVMFRCGLRAGEVAGLRKSSIDWTRKRLKVRSSASKSRKDRLMPFDDEVGRWLSEYLFNMPLYPESPDALWLSDKGDGSVRGVMTHYALHPMLRRRCQKLGIAVVNPHSFRHGFAMELLNRGGAELSSVGTLLGHASVKTTEQAYARWLIDDLQREYEEAQRRINGSSKGEWSVSANGKR